MQIKTKNFKTRVCSWINIPVLEVRKDAKAGIMHYAVFRLNKALELI